MCLTPVRFLIFQGDSPMLRIIAFKILEVLRSGSYLFKLFQIVRHFAPQLHRDGRVDSSIAMTGVYLLIVSVGDIKGQR